MKLSRGERELGDVPLLREYLFMKDTTENKRVSLVMS